MACHGGFPSNRLGTFVIDGQDAEVQYAISPYREDSDEDEMRAARRAKKVPNWARSHNLGPSLRLQEAYDPDWVFAGFCMQTCTLSSVFGPEAAASDRKAWERRNSSGDWHADRVSEQEVLDYRRAMGYAVAPAPGVKAS